MDRIQKSKAAFICVHNSCRSQIAQALGKHLAADVFDSYSAGTQTKPQINQDALRLMKQIYGIDMEQTQQSKLLDELPPIDIVIKMGCEVCCPIVAGQHVQDWDLDDPSGKRDDAFRHTIRKIHQSVLALMEAIESGEMQFS